jgi:hypothetical protein
MDMNDLKRVNSLWEKIYPHLASQIMENYQRDFGMVLEFEEMVRKAGLLEHCTIEERGGLWLNIKK